MKKNTALAPDQGRKPEQPTQPPAGRAVHLGLADGIGLVSLVTLLGYFASFRDPINLPRMAALWVGSAFLLPFVIRRWRSLTWRHAAAIPAAAAVGLLGWGLLSALLSGGPLGLSIYGWWGRSDGLLTLAGVSILLLAAATLGPTDVQRTLLWLLAGLAAVGLVGLGQWRGVIDWGQGVGVDALLGNPNIAAGLCAVGAVLLGVLAADGSVPVWLRATRAAVALLLLIVAVVNGSAQGPATIALSALAALAFAGLAASGRARWGLLTLAVIGLVGIVALTALAVSGMGPVAALWSDANTQIRVAAWGAGVETMAAHPAFGTGPGGMERYFFEFVPDAYVAIVGPQVPVNALHNIALQFGATLGIPALLLWLVVFAGSAIVLARAAWRRGVSVPMAGALGGALLAYLVQGMVSIDMVALMALGWLVAGLCLAAGRAQPLEVGDSPSPAARGAAAPMASVALGLVAAFLLLPQLRAVPPGGAALDQGLALSVLSNPLTPCHIRVDIASQAVTQLAPDVGPPAVYSAARLDPRCLTMAHIAAQAALSHSDFATAGEFSSLAITQDPTFVISWTLRARYDALTGDVAAARADLAMARQQQAGYPDPAPYEQEISELEVAINAMG